MSNSTDSTRADIPQFALPLRFKNGMPVVLEQDSPEEVRQCVAVLLRTRLGQRAEQPDYGVPDPTFRREIDLDELRDRINEWEPRAEVVLGQDFDLEELVNEVSIGVALSDG